MGDENRSLDETDASKELSHEIIKERERFQRSLAEVQKQTAEALKPRDEASFQALKEVQDDYKDRIAQLERARENLKSDLENLHKEKYLKIEAKLQEAENRHQERFRRIEEGHFKGATDSLDIRPAAEQQIQDIPAEVEVQENAISPTASHIEGNVPEVSSLK